MDGAVSFDAYRMPDELWQQMQFLLPPYIPSPLGGRPRAVLRDVADAIFYRIRTGCQWKAIPRCLAAGSTAHSYFQQWVEQGVFDDLWQLALELFDDLVGLDWRWQAVDGAMTKAPLGGEATGKNPTDRAKLGTKRSLMTDARGIPVGLAVSGANTHDSRLLQATLENRLLRFPRDPNSRCERLLLDKAYDSQAIRTLVEEQLSFRAHIRSRHQEIREKERARPRRWVVERTHSWLNRFRGVLLRWEKKVDNHIAILQLACAFYTLKQAQVLG
ncbi:transposase IS4 family protein [Pirellula staleyi DSM 6068]|uniref:Transposase IS4 family protein n=1 Tax=Pirellula staleyi (strain ATCC 27377 / DSM 6068 / ICPB 4128) TaxID=530564 RepID=D2R779_PIRSD|nr:IS5-like element ISPist1 family transposase [Pirellula staleyi]ADB15575.1 transposase IS4 family protein [Pirellula staleyi DSM 6068]